MDILAAAFDAIAADPAVGDVVDYESAAGGQGVYGIRALQRRLDAEGGFGDVRISHDVRRFEIRVSDLAGLPDPARNDRIYLDGITYLVQAIPSKDDKALAWLIDAYRA